jgi:starch synthase
MKVLLISSEVAPWSKTGGLADVAGALPRALSRIGLEVLVVTPLYAQVVRAGLTQLEPELSLRFPFGIERARLLVADPGPRHRVLFLDHPGYYARGGIYHEHGRDYWDNHRRFAFLSVGALTAAQLLGFSPDIVHLNDWQTGLAALALQSGYRASSLSHARSVFTVHNLAFTGSFPKEAMGDLGIPWSEFTADGVEFFDRLSFLKAGLSYADALTTVSPTYAKEIQTPEAGWGMDGLLRRRAKDLQGILNGVDAEVWDPRTDAFLAAHFDEHDLGGKAACKRALLEQLGLDPDEGPPLFGVVSRLAEQKGLDILLPALPRLLEAGAKVVVLGSGEPRYERALGQLAAHRPGQMAARFRLDERLAHLIEAGSDFFLMPSLYEPCGLNQLYSLRYGTVPIVRAVGGLEDSVVDLSAPGATGIKFGPYHPGALMEAMGRALGLYANPGRIHDVRRRGMRQDVSWDRAARAYQALYERLAPQLPQRQKAK